MVGGVYGDSRTRCLADRRFECGYGLVKVKCVVNRLVNVKSKVKVSTEQLPIGLEIVVLYSRGVGCWLEEDFEHYGVVIRGKCGNSFWFR
jgi:hypothetical protein